MDPEHAKELRRHLLDMARRPNFVTRVKPLFTQTGFGLEEPDVRQGSVRLYITPDPTPDARAMLKKDLEKRLPGGMFCSGDVVCPRGIRARTWLEITDVHLTEMTRSVGRTTVACILCLIVMFVYVFYCMNDLQASLIL